MLTLLVLRHAKSSWNNAQLTDHDRPLNKRGRRDAPRVGAHLAATGRAPDRIVTSTARRAADTAAAVALACEHDGPIDHVERMYHAAPGDILAVLRALRDDDGIVLIVGHNPGLEAFVSRLSGRDVTLKTAHLAEIALDEDAWSALDRASRGRLEDLWRPPREG